MEQNNDLFNDIKPASTVQPEQVKSRKSTKKEKSKKSKNPPIRLSILKGLQNVDGLQIKEDTFKQVQLVSFDGGKTVSPITDATIITIGVMLEASGFKMKFTDSMLRNLVRYLAAKNQFNSQQDWLNAQLWDGVNRVETFFIDYCGLEDTPHHRAAGLYMWSALAGRCLQPGIKADIVIMLFGKQGIGKTSLVQALVPFSEWYGRIDLMHRDKELIRMIRARSVIEIGELAGFSKRDHSELKALFSETSDLLRRNYEEEVNALPRTCIFFSTSNTFEVLSDEENRRYGPIELIKRADLEKLIRDRPMLWAEAKRLFESQGIMWQEFEETSKGEHWKYEVVSTDRELVEEFLHKELPYDSRLPDYLRACKTPADAEYLVVSDIALLVFNIPKTEQGEIRHRRLFNEIAKTLRLNGWSSGRKRKTTQEGDKNLIRVFYPPKK